MIICASVLFLLGTASIACAGASSKPATTQVSPKVFVDQNSTTRNNVTELIIPNGQSAELKCSRGGVDKPDNSLEIMLYSATYGQNFTSKAQGSCQDTKVKDELSKICERKPTCKVTAQDQSTVAGCGKKSLRVQYICRNLRHRGAYLPS